jgi:hypothetical protein
VDATTYRLGDDLLYGITLRPQELALYGERVRFHLRYAPICELDSPAALEHHKILVLEIVCELPPDPQLGRLAVQELELLKCGWQLQVLHQPACRPQELPELPEEVPRLLDRIRETVNELGRRAGLAELLKAVAVQRLASDYAARHR